MATSTHPNEEKESSPDSSSVEATSASSSFPSLSTTPPSSQVNEVSRSSSGDIQVIDAREQLHLQVPAHHHHDHPNSISTGSNSSQSSPRPSTTTLPEDILATSGRVRGGSSSSSSLSIGQISYRDLSDIQDEFKIVKILHDGSFSKILLAKQDDTEESSSSSGGKGSGSSKYLVLKAIPSSGLFTDDFKRELSYNYFLSPHPNIVTSFNISFNWASCFNVFVQEHAPFGDLSRYININSNSGSNNYNRKCLPECQVKLIASQLASALEFMHSFKLVHQDIRPENVLIFKSNMNRVKLCDFGSTRKEGTLLTKGHLISSSTTSTSLLAPELSYLLPQERYECHRSSDVWQMGILLCICLTGKYPWDVAEFSDPNFRQYTSWLKRKSLRIPDSFKRFTPRLVRLLKRLLEPKQHLRSEMREVYKYLKDDWIKQNCNNRMIGNNTSNLNNSGSFKLKRAAASLKKRQESHIVGGSGNSNKNGSNKLIILTSNGINLLGPNVRKSSKDENQCISSSVDVGGNNKQRRESQNSNTSGGANSSDDGGIVVVVEDNTNHRHDDDNTRRIEPGQEDSQDDEDDNMSKRVENWVASAAARALLQHQTNNNRAPRVVNNQENEAD